MAKIIGLVEKQNALKEVKIKLKSLAPVNEFLNADNASGIYSIGFDSFRTFLLCDDKDAIKSLVFAYKKNIVSEIRALAEKNSIELDEEDEKMLK